MGIFNGLSGFPLTPTDTVGKLDADAFRRLLAHLAGARADGHGLDSICILGSTGTYAYLTPDERMLAAEAAIDQIGEQLPVIVGIGTLRTDDAVRLARHADDAGANGLLMAPMSYTPLTEAEVLAHYAAVAGATNLPLCIYNNPSTTHFTFTPALLQRLAALPTIEAVKMPLPADGGFEVEIANLRADLPDGFIIGYSGDWECPDALLAGADSWFSVIAGLLPEPTLKLAHAAMRGDAAQTARLQDCFSPLWALFRQYGSLRVVYTAANLLGITTAQPPLPIQPLPQDQHATLQEALSTLNAA
ncbi:dihydrodipicolinate synthase family protein [Paracoccus caeni]|uniref:Dihydrodipicolinate synthase family protein n=1 Tax=Paracoccus caeni TaxID=657651 RepID=A0A934SDL9_9RHOB|nr:dihydrodipicolinate synthase family protein [Paracoccus caeni]MBK4216951.1 dihydrodipicolinate synthase family protein [Paracoccus caeni]